MYRSWDYLDFETRPCLAVLIMSPERVSLFLPRPGLSRGLIYSVKDQAILAVACSMNRGRVIELLKTSGGRGGRGHR